MHIELVLSSIKHSFEDVHIGEVFRLPYDNRVMMRICGRVSAITAKPISNAVVISDDNLGSIGDVITIEEGQKVVKLRQVRPAGFEEE